MSLTDLIRNPEIFDQQQQRDDGGLYGGIFEFDADDPDFDHARSPTSMTSCGSSSSLKNRANNFSMASVTMPGLRKVKTSPMALSKRVNYLDCENNYCRDEELMDSTESDADSTHQLTIEDLRQHLNSCFSCGVSWQEEHVSLDCAECGGYSLTRPCPLCEGKCGQLWKRDLATSHSLGKANWNGSCPLTPLTKEPTDLLSHQFIRLRTSNS